MLLAYSAARCSTQETGEGQRGAWRGLLQCAWMVAKWVHIGRQQFVFWTLNIFFFFLKRQDYQPY